MGSSGQDDDPLARLAAEQEWRDRVRSVEREAAKARRKARLRIVRPRSGSRGGFRQRRSGRSISWLFFALLGMTAATGAAVWAGIGPVQFMVFLFVLGTWLIALCLHEF